MASTGGGASQQPGGFQFGSFQPRRVVNQTIGKLTNHSVPRTSVVRRLQTKGDRYIRKGQYVFMHTKPPQDNRLRREEIAPVETLLNLPLVNYYLAKLSEVKAYQEMSAVDIANEFVPHGVVLNSVGEDVRENAERMMVCTVRGFADTFNVWGNNCYDGDSLYFAYKKVKLVAASHHPGYKFDFNGGAARFTAANCAELAGGDKWIWQVIPCTRHGDDRPTVAALRDTTNDDMTNDTATATDGDGVVRYVGRIQHARSARTLDGRTNNTLVWKHLTSMTNQFQFTMFLDH